VSGEVRYGGAAPTAAFLQRRAGYVEQASRPRRGSVAAGAPVPSAPGGAGRGQPRGASAMHPCCGPCYTNTHALTWRAQFDTLIPTLTVREMLAYTAALKTSHKAPAAARAAAVEGLLRELDLEGCADVLIGDRLRKGVSGGQARGDAHGVGPGGAERPSASARTARRGWAAPGTCGAGGTRQARCFAQRPSHP
jgi:hypothetical protein